MNKRLLERIDELEATKSENEFEMFMHQFNINEGNVSRQTSSTPSYNNNMLNQLKLKLFHERQEFKDKIEVLKQDHHQYLVMIKQSFSEEIEGLQAMLSTQGYASSQLKEN